MAESKAEVQALVKFLLGDPNNVESFRKNRQAILEKFGATGIDNKVLEKISVLDMGFFKGDGQLDEYTNHCDCIASTERFSTRIRIDFNAIVKKIIVQLILNESEYANFKTNPNAIFAEYGIAPNQELANIVNSILGTTANTKAVTGAKEKFAR